SRTSSSLVLRRELAALPAYHSPAAAAPQLSTLSLHDALPIYPARRGARHRPAQADPPLPRLPVPGRRRANHRPVPGRAPVAPLRSEEHTSELQSLRHLVCRLLLEKKKNISPPHVPQLPKKGQA